MIDRSLNFVYLSEKVPGMFHLLHILGAIWTQIQHISKITVQRNGRWYYNDPGVEQNLMQDSEEYIIEEPISRFFSRCTTEYIEKLLRIKTPEEENFPKLKYPKFLNSFVKVQLSHWISSAISAKLYMRLGYEYVLHDGKITVVDANRTGVLEFSMTWSNGLHQFLQMKHGCQITPENLTTNYISNVTYLQRYSTNLIGLTGTIGGDSDRKLLRNAYSTDCVVLPPYREPRHIQLTPITGISRIDWLQKVVTNVSKKLDFGQAGLVVTNYIKEAEDIAEMLKIKHGSKILKYTKNSESSVTQKVLEPGECIIATNIAGRGTDVLVTKEVENAGGLHVCVTFLPENCRVERQNIGRTSRTGNRGTSQFIVLQENSIEEATIALQRLRETRDIYVMACVEQSLKQIETAHQKDRTFKQFCLLKDSIQASINPEINEYIQEALNEKFGHWLLKNQKNLSTAEFENFERQCRNNPEERIIENSFIFVKMAEDSIQNKNFYQANEYLTKAINLDDELAANAYYLRGYVKIILYNQNTKKRSLITGAIEDLEKARKIIENEHQVNINLICSDFSRDDSVQIMEQLGRYKTLFGAIINSINAAIGQEIQAEIDELENALDNKDEIDSEQKENLQNRRNYLVDNRIDLENGALKLARKNGRQVTIKKLDFDEALPPDERKELFKDSIKEMNLNGFYRVFIFNEKTPINWGSVIGVGLLGLGQLAAGAATAFFSVGIGIGIGYALIQEGVCDLIAAVKDGIINRNFSWARWGIQKAISLAITVACAGFAALKSAASGAVRGMKVVANAAKEGIKSTAKAAFKASAKLIGMEVAKGATKEIIAPFINYAISNTIEEPLKEMVNLAVNNTVASYLRCDSNINILIECDRKNRNYKYAKKLEEKLLWFLNKDPDVYREFGRDIMRRLEGRIGGLTGSIINLVSQGTRYQEILTIIHEVMQNLPAYVKELANSDECQTDFKKAEPETNDDIVRVSAINVTLEEFCQHISQSVSTMIVSFAMGAFVQKISSSCVNSAFKSISNHVNQEIEEFRNTYGGVDGKFEELDTKMDSRLRLHALKLEENIKIIESGGPASAVHVESLARSIKQQIIVVDGSETIVFGEAHPGTEPIVLNYEQGEDGEVGHYTLANGKVVNQTGKNSCLFDAVAAETGISADELRKETATTMVHNFRQFSEVERANDDLSLLGGASQSAKRHTYGTDTRKEYSDDDYSESCETNGLDQFEQNVEKNRPSLQNKSNKIRIRATKGQPRTTLYIDSTIFDNNMQKEFDRVFDNLLKAGTVQESQRSTYPMNIQIKGKVKGCQRISTGGNLSPQQWMFFENPVFKVKGGQAIHYQHNHSSSTKHTRIRTRDGGPPTKYKQDKFQFLFLKKTTEEEYYDDSDEEEEESEMQFMQASEPSEVERNVQFRHSFEKHFKGRYDINGPIDRWLKMMTDESIVVGKRAGNYHQQQQQCHRHQYYFNDDDIIQEENETDDTLDEEEKNDETVVAENEEKALQILEICESILKQLEIVTAVPTKKHNYGLQRNLATINKYEIDCESTTPRAASSTFVYEESFDIIRY
uniref:Protein translocase subunit SecA n=1 Tax=Panagrolaimus davidi TaxID=227884 RepID=A0A914PSA0_9BILA